MCNPPSNRGAITVYATFVAFPIVAISAPLTPGIEVRMKGAVSCQHSKAEMLFFVTSVVIVRKVSFVVWARVMGKEDRRGRRDDGRIFAWI